ncbi:hypothetical protein BMG523Draft_00098 [Frankia sp. BMG5.23]|nr:hypothetical protein BMG523Draft_00098 [Frankia sp. BMG5.23]
MTPLAGSTPRDLQGHPMSRRSADTWRDPTRAELAAIEREWPAIAADLAALDAEIAAILTADTPAAAGVLPLTARPTGWREAA